MFRFVVIAYFSLSCVFRTIRHLQLIARGSRPSHLQIGKARGRMRENLPEDADIIMVLWDDKDRDLGGLGFRV